MSAVPTEADVVRGDLNGKGEGVIGVMSGRDKISLHSGALLHLVSPRCDEVPCLLPHVLRQWLPPLPLRPHQCADLKGRQYPAYRGRENPARQPLAHRR